MCLCARPPVQLLRRKENRAWCTLVCRGRWCARRRKVRAWPRENRSSFFFLFRAETGALTQTVLQRYGISGEMAILPSTRAASGAPAAVAAAGCCCASDGATRSGLAHIGGIVSDLFLNLLVMTLCHSLGMYAPSLPSVRPHPTWSNINRC